MFAGILLKTFWYLYRLTQCQNDSSKPVYVVRNDVSTFLSLVNKGKKVKNIVFTTNIRYLWKGTNFEGVIL